MEKQENKGYQITDSIQVGDTAFVIGHSEKLPYPYVVWKQTEAQNTIMGIIKTTVAKPLKIYAVGHSKN